MHARRSLRFAAAHAAGLLLSAGVGQAQEAAGPTPAAAPALVLELNAAQPSQKGCRLTFVVTNNLGAEVSKAAFEIALFDDAGVVDRLTVLDFSELPAGKTKVSRFDLAGADCAKISRVLVNHATECSGAGLDAKACLTGLKLVTKTDIVFGV